mmetsp:Transcript_29808/g.53947  ORF Transcript_29808/g.53947 Transcript_29808/m.53947 type:complete len:95 (-) Transcript_29808:1157-1441(-)
MVSTYPVNEAIGIQKSIVDDDTDLSRPNFDHPYLRCRVKKTSSVAGRRHEGQAHGKCRIRRASLAVVQHALSLARLLRLAACRVARLLAQRLLL